MTANISSKDRNVLTLTLACLFLSLLILGISFTHVPAKEQVLYSMDVILSKKMNVQAPEEADYLAQNNQLGGGTEDKKVRPQNITNASSPTQNGMFKKETPERRKKHSERRLNNQLTQKQSDIQVNQNQTAEKGQQHQNDSVETPAQKLARIENELAKKIEKYAKKPRSKYISSSTKAYEYAPYIKNWVTKIEQTGDLNYPEQAKKENFKGSVILSVGIKKDGSIHEIKIIKPSPHGFLNKAAKHIVTLAQPFDPLPETKERVDILYITRTWQFLPGHLLRHK